MSDEVKIDKRVTLEVSRDGWTKGYQLSINLMDGPTSGTGYRLAGPKFNGSSTAILTVTLDERDAREIREHLDAVFPAALSVPSEPVPDGPRVWALPVVPSDVQVVSDRDGWIWRRATDYDIDRWWRRAGGMLSAESRLIDERGPLTEVVEEATP